MSEKIKVGSPVEDVPCESEGSARKAKLNLRVECIKNLGVASGLRAGKPTAPLHCTTTVALAC
jgi:hypothetical protein